MAIINPLDANGNPKSTLYDSAGTQYITAGVAGTVSIGGNQAAGSNISANVNPQLIGGSDYGGTAKLQTLKVDANGLQYITTNATQSVSGTLQSAQSGNANGSTLNILGMGSLVLTINTTGFTGTVNFEVSEDGTNFDTLFLMKPGTNSYGTNAGFGTSTGIATYTGSVWGGYQLFRARTSSVSAGTVTVTAHAVPLTGLQVLNQASATQSGTWAIRLNDGSGNAITSTSSALDINLKSSGATVSVSQSGTWTMQPGNTANTTPWLFTINQGGNSADVTSRNAILAEGPTASGVSLAASPITTGGLAKTALPTAVSDGQVVNDMKDKYGRSVMMPYGTRELYNNITQLTLTSTTETTLIAAVASQLSDIVDILCINTSATATQVDFRDSTGGTIQFSVYVPAGATVGFSNHFYKQTTANTNWTAKCSTGVSSIVISGSYLANK